jgi:hypothetical protein
VLECIIGYVLLANGGNAMQIVIEKNVPMHKAGIGKWRQAEAAIAKMDVGDSFLFQSNTVPSPLYGSANLAGVKVMIGKIGEGQYRIWRKA